MSYEREQQLIHELIDAAFGQNSDEEDFGGSSSETEEYLEVRESNSDSEQSADESEESTEETDDDLGCDGMTESVVHEWLADYGSLSPVEVHSFASSLEHDQEVVAAIYNVLEERSKYQDVCHTLFY
uniref:Uncharacterized protein n=1 Tax=Timema shepardi TaxID=629360 RepID=A0A7R9B013_TIMSH|nr:unnamed protein product [Timema shepardi]